MTTKNYLLQRPCLSIYFLVVGLFHDPEVLIGSTFNPWRNQMFLPSLAEQNVPSVLGGTVSRDSVRGCVSVVPIGPRVVRWYKAATRDS
jgi:hypothetical protein